MKYKYNKRQLIGKKLEVPKRILEKIYQCTLSFPEWIEYDLVDKIPTTCLLEEDKKIVERFHIEKAKTLDWELLNKRITDTIVNIKELILKVDPSKEDLNGELYELVKNHISPNDYSSLMKEKYQERILEEQPFLNDFNKGNLSLEKILINWDTFKNKDLTNCLLKDKQNTTHLTNEEVKNFMTNYEDLAPLIVNHNNIYSFLTGFKDLSEDEKERRIKRLADDMILYPETNISNEEAKVLSKYIPILDYLKIIDEEEAEKLIKELESLDTNYLYDSPIPFYQILSYSVLKFISTYGLKNIVEFNQECGNFFTKNNCKMLKDMYNLYLYYGGNKQDPNKTFYTKPNSEKRPYTKDEFYEAMKRMIMSGPTNLNRINEAPDYREMTGEFQKRNQELFLREDAPQELKDLFYTKKITPQLLLDKTEYIPYLRDKKLSSCMEEKKVTLENDSTTTNIYDLIQDNNDFIHTIKFITDYCDILDILSKRNNIKLGKEDNLEQIKNKINHYFIKTLITKRIPFPKNIPYELIEKYPSLFLNSNASKEIKEAYYNRTININTILSHPEDIKYLEKINPELFIYTCML